MAIAVAAARLSRLLGAAVLLAVTAGAWVLPATPSHAATTHTVDVSNSSNGSLHPANLEVHTGDTVVWEWVANEWHSIVVADHGRSACSPLDPAQAPCKGHTFEVTFEEAGEYGVRDEVTGSAGMVTVTRPPPPKPTPSPTPSSPSPTASPPPAPSPSEPEATETTEPDPDPTSPTATEAPTASEPPPPPPEPTTGTAAPPPVDTETLPDPTPSVGDPSVASAEDSPSPVPDPTFEEFPDPVDPTPAGGVEGEVALGLDEDGGGGGTRLLWGVVGGVTLLGTLGAFGRTVLFSEPWEA